MPICTKADLERPSQPVGDFGDNEEVFHCETTKEIFRNYEDYFRRIMLINSTVWACEYTGRSDLTYEEALKSEKHARKLATYFSVPLRGPVLLAAKRARQSTLNTLANLLYQFFRDRYFSGEAVLATIKKNKLCECKIVEVIASKHNSQDGVYPADNIKYKIQKVGSNNPDDLLVVSSTEIRRFGKSLTRDTLQYFLKQSIELSSSGYLVPKEDAYKKYITETNTSFESLFVGKLPDWKPVKSRKNVPKESKDTDNDKPIQNGSSEKGKGKEKKQETLSKYLVKKNGEAIQKEKEKQEEVERILRERLQKLQKEKEERQAEIERKRIERYEKIEEKWLKISKKCDDLEREDQKPMPPLTPVRTVVPVKYFGDVLHIKEFIQSHAQIMSPNPFKDKISFYEMCRAFTTREVAGPLSDILQLLLNTIFTLQLEEDDDCKTKYVEIPRREHREKLRNAGATHRFVQKHYSCRLIDLPIDAFSLSEVLRLHFLSSGATPDEKTERWRFAYRNGYDSAEDPGLDLVDRQPHILRALKLYSVYQLPFSDIIKIINCLIHQILTHSGALNLIEERSEAYSEVQKKLRAIQVAENKRIALVTNEKKQLAGELSIQSADLTVEEEKKKLENQINKKVEKMINHDENQREKFVTELTNLEANLFDHIVHLGSDRAYRNYYIFESLPGIFVEHLPESNDICLEKPPKNDYRIAHCPHNKKEIKLLLLKMIAQEDREKEKWKNVAKHTEEANKENHAFVSNGELTRPNGTAIVLPINGEVEYEHPELPSAYDLYMCTGDPKHCIVHDERNPDRIRWSFIHTEEDLEDLIDSLNPYGIREGVLRENVLRFKSLICEHIKKCPVDDLSVTDGNKQEFKNKVLSETLRRYRDANFGADDGNIAEVMCSVLVDDILDFEANLTAGFLGKLKIKNREQWRADIRNNSYNAQCAKLIYGYHDQTYKDPGEGLADTVEIESEDSADDEISLHTSPELLKSVKNLASALLQIEQGIDQRFLKSPFGITVDRNVTKDDERYEAGRKRLKLWEISLMASTSYSQIYLHKSILNATVKWHRSSLKARCLICNRRGDAQNLLLCDDCNAGSHIYCLEPKLKSIPPDDWYCCNCKAKRDEAEKTKEKKRRSPKKKVFKMDEDEDAEEDEKELHNEIANEKIVDNGMDEGSCYTCFEEGGEITCSKCKYWFHLECVDMRRPPRGKWECSTCKMKERKRKPAESDKDSVNSDEILSRRSKRHRLMLSDEESEGSDPKRSKRSITAKQTASRRSGRTAAEDLPLNSSVLYELLNDIMKHEDAWPFIRPVSQHELPDYYHVITKPMDFARVKSNLNMAYYKTNEQVMKDIELVFSNCDVYNQQGNDIYNAGASLEKFVVERCKQLNLPFTPSDMLIESTNK